MAEENNETFDITSCIVCFEHYDSELHCPRVLPCFHTLCQQCLPQLIRKKPRRFIVNCPECRKEHVVPDESFPENRYILAYLSTLSTQSNVCEDHKRPLVMYCKTEGCERLVCHQCLLKGGHQDHDVVDEQEHRVLCKGEVIEDIEALNTKIQSFRKCLVDTEKKLKSTTEFTHGKIDRLEASFKCYIEECAGLMRANVSDNFLTENSKITEQIARCDKQTNILQDIERGLTHCSIDAAKCSREMVQHISVNMDGEKLDDVITADALCVKIDDGRKQYISGVFQLDVGRLPGFGFSGVEPRCQKLAEKIQLSLADMESSGEDTFTNVAPSGGPIWQIFVKFPHGETKTYRIGCSDTILDLKNTICMSEGIPTENQVLTRFCGTTLAFDSLSLQDYGLENNSNLSLKII